jgi:quinol-cytochrome oxidoreductase complex cytochrome b subunit
MQGYIDDNEVFYFLLSTFFILNETYTNGFRYEALDIISLAAILCVIQKIIGVTLAMHFYPSVSEVFNYTEHIIMYYIPFIRRFSTSS